MTRLHQVLIAVLVAQLAIGAAVFWPRSASGGPAGGALFGQVEAKDIVSLTVRDVQGNSIKLGKQGDKWVLPDADGFPLDAARIDGALAKLTAIKTNRLVTSTEGSFKRLKVADDEFERRLDLQTAGGSGYTLFLGSSPSFGATHFRLSGQSNTYLTGEISTSDVGTSAAGWIDTAYVNVPQADVTSLALQNSNGAISFAKNAQGAWTMDGLAAGEQLSQNNLTSLLATAANIQMLLPLGKGDKPEYGLSKPGAVVVFKAKTGNEEKTYTVTVGAKGSSVTDSASYAVKFSESPYIVRVSDYAVKDLVEKKRADYLQPPATPAPAGPALLPTSRP